MVTLLSAVSLPEVLLYLGYFCRESAASIHSPVSQAALSLCFDTFNASQSGFLARGELVDLVNTLRYSRPAPRHALPASSYSNYRSPPAFNLARSCVPRGPLKAKSPARHLPPRRPHSSSIPPRRPRCRRGTCGGARHRHLPPPARRELSRFQKKNAPAATSSTGLRVSLLSLRCTATS
jgi:hypothetical protein